MSIHDQSLSEALRLMSYDYWTDTQLQAFEYWVSEEKPGLTRDDRMCVYYPTGAGKTEIALVSLFLSGVTEALVVAPPLTQQRWIEDGAKLGITVTAMSHAKFRMKTTKLKADVAVVVDEFHMLGGHTGQGWLKGAQLSKGLNAPLIICSATPNYNDVERVFCVQHVMNPLSTRGGYIHWLYQHCVTEQNPFGATPVVQGLKNYVATDELTAVQQFLIATPGVVFAPDTAPDILRDVDVRGAVPPFDLFEEYNLDTVQRRFVASLMEKTHRRRYKSIIDEETGDPRKGVQEAITVRLTLPPKPVLIYCDHATIAERVAAWLDRTAMSTGLITGKTTPTAKKQLVELFKQGKLGVLVGTASIATGTDGIDKVCDTMIIVDDTNDDSLRRQLVGRILHRGVGGTNAGKIAYRFLYS